MNTKLYSESADSKESPWDNKKFSLSLDPGITFLPYFYPVTFEVLNFSFRPTRNFQITLKNGLEFDLYESLLAGYSHYWNRFRWYAETGIRIDWQPYFLFGPEISTGFEYLLLDWLSLGLKFNGSFLIDTTGQGCCSEGFAANLTQFQAAALLTVSFVF